ncbi:unnamed protein product [Trichogramma brassicae]|uniref:Serpin domain-containing protein n=1 Tax=Trichogramma brassicae TaxID=86971 RepID=A0A6H5IML0_9HYME|nr:unnamed protein product [Trichogramma brassicae]
MRYLVLTILLATCCLCQDVIFPDQLQALKEASEYDLSKQKDESMSERFYKADIFGVDYENGAEAKKLINDWVSNKTEGLIPSMLSDAPNAETQAIIASALYFEGEWMTHFMPEEFTRR